MSDLIAAHQLRLFIERIERLKEEIKGLQDDVKDVFNEAKSQGFDKKTMAEIIKLRAMDEHARREREALLDTYKAALGMLDGTPLGRWAIERLHPTPEDDGGDDDDGSRADPPAPEPAATSSETVEEAREMGAAAARAGSPVTSNPFPARDVRRAAWDEAWCSAIGSDGMEIPDAWKPTKRRPQAKDEAA